MSAILFLGVVLSCQTMGIRLTRDDAVIIPVRVDGQGPYPFLLDTGTTTTLLGLDVAAELAVHPVDRVRLVTPGGERIAVRARLGSLAVGDPGPRSLGEGGLTVEAPLVVLQDLGALRARVGAVRGVLGQDVLGRVDYVLDYGRKEIRFVDGEDCAAVDGRRVPFARVGGRVVVRGRDSRTEGPGFPLVLDSGATHLVLFETDSGGPAIAVSRYFREPGRIDTSLGSRFTWSGWVPELVVGTESFRDLPVAIVALGSTALRAEAGLLPTRLFRRVYFNNAENYVVLGR